MENLRLHDYKQDYHFYYFNKIFFDIKSRYIMYKPDRASSTFKDIFSFPTM